ncbi:MAG TPA: hypothetical protein VEB64_15670 [Azospirillaceae bacterium]|nr:hypothetical protein [Azospirillaceae bacterium]
MMSDLFEKFPFYLETGRIVRDYDVRRLKKFETPGIADRRAVLLARRTKRRSAGTVTPRFAACAKGSRCNSGACPRCMRLFRRWFGHAAMSLIGGEAVTFVTVVGDAFGYEAGSLHRFDPVAAMTWLRRLLSKAGLGTLTVVGGLDISFNVDGEKRWPDHWRPHFALLVLGSNPERVKAALEPFIKASESVPRPVQAKNVTDPLAVITYLVKAAYFRRSSYRAENGRYNTRRLPLKAAQEHELTLFLDQYQPEARLFLQNTRIEKAGLVRMSAIRR